MKQVALRESENPQRWRGALLLAYLSWSIVGATYRSSPASKLGGTCFDFGIFLRAAQRLNHGQPIYRLPAGGAYGYSPLLAEFLRPLAHLPIHCAQQVWFGVETLSLLLAVALYARAAGIRLPNAVPVALFLLVGFRTTMVYLEYNLGQTNLILLALLCGAMLADRHGKLRIVAILIALAALIKVWMLGLVVYLALRRAWKEVGVAILTFAYSIALLFSLVGWGQFPTLIRIVVGSAGLPRGNSTFSFPGYARVHLLGPLIQTHFIAYLGFVLLGAAIVGGGLVYVARTMPEATPTQRRLQMNITMLSLLLMLPACEFHYYLLALPALWELLCGDNWYALRHAWAIFVGAILVFTLLSHCCDFLHQWVPVEFAAGIALWVLSLAALVSSRRAAMK